MHARSVIKTRSPVRPLLSAALLLTLFSCGTDPGEPEVTVATVIVTPASPSLVSINETVQLAATAQDAGGDVISGKTFTWTSSDGTVGSVNGAGLVTAVSNGTVTITATTDGVDGTALVDVHQQAAQLAFTVEPTTVERGAPIVPGVAVVILDALGTAVGDAALEVAMTLDVNPSNGTLSGATAVDAVDGTATFPDLAIDLAGRDYALLASSANLASATSAPFNVLSGLPADTVWFSPDGVTIEGIDVTHDFRLQADDANGDPTLPPTTTWSSLNPDVAAMASLDALTGRATAHREGQVTIVAEAGGSVTHALVTVAVPGTPLPTTWAWNDFNSNELTDVWATAANDVWAVGWSGTVLHYDGARWNDAAPGLVTNDLFGVWASGASDVWVVGRQSVLHYDGATWSDLNGELFDWELMSVWGSGSNDVWIAGGNIYGEAVLFHFDGTAWSDVTSTIPGTPLRLTTIWGSGPSDVWTAGREGAVLHYDGDAWTAAGPATFVLDARDLFGSSGSDVWLIGYNEAWHYDGVEWEDRTAGIDVSYGKVISAAWTNGPGTVWITAGRSSWHYDGAVWTEVPVPWDHPGGGTISGTGPGDIWAVTLGGEIAYYDKIAWTNETPRLTTATPFAMWGSTPSDIWAAGADEVFLHYDGVQWIKSVFDSVDPLQVNAMWGSSSDNVWAVGRRGRILHFDGVEWTETMHGLTTSVLNDVWGSGPTDIWSVGEEGTILRFDGTDWTTMSSPVVATTLRGVWGRSASDVWVAGANGTTGVLLHYDGTSLTDETPTTTVLPLNDVWGTGPGDIWVAGDRDMLLHFTGESWINTAPGQEGYFQELWGTGPADVWALGGSGVCCPRRNYTLFHYDGTGWTDVTPGRLTWRWISAIWGSRSGPLWAWGTYGTRLKGTR